MKRYLLLLLALPLFAGQANLRFDEATGVVVNPAVVNFTTTTLQVNGVDVSTFGAGDVVGPASSTDNALSRYDQATGTLLQDSLVTVDDSGNVTTPAEITANSIPLSQAAANAQSTGIISYAGMTINVDTTKFDTGAAVAWFVDSTTDPENPTVTVVNYAGETGVIDAHLATANITYVGLNSSGVLVQQGSPFTDAQRRTIAVLSRSGHPDRAAITTTFSFPNVSLSPAAQVHDLMEAIGTFNADGNEYYAGAADLNIYKNAGFLFSLGSNYENDPETPHTKTIAAATPITSMLYVYQDGTSEAATAVDPDNYDVASVKTTVPGNAKFTIQRVYMFGGGFTNILYGQTTYSTMAEAQAAVGTEVFVEPAIFGEAATLMAVMIVQKGATSLQAPADVFIQNVSKFGGGSGSSVGGSTTMQVAYNNSSEPEILTDATLGAVSLKRGSALDADDVFEILNGAGTQVASVTGDGVVLSSTYQLREQADANADVAGVGQIWVNLETPNTLWFTDDAGSDVQLGAGSLANVVEDVTPQLGGPLDTNGYIISGAQASDVASATALQLTNTGNYFDVTGTTTITSFAWAGGYNPYDGTIIYLQFDGALTLTHHATDLILQGGVNITTAAGDHAVFMEYATDDWRCVDYQPAAAPGDSIWVPAAAMVPDGAAPPAASTETSGSLYATDTWAFDDTTVEYLHFVISAPQNFVAGTPITATVHHRHAAIVGTSVWKLEMEGVTNSTVFPASFTDSSGDISQTVSGTTLELNTVTSSSFSVTQTDNFDLIFCRLQQVAGTATVIGDSRLVGLKLNFTTE